MHYCFYHSTVNVHDSWKYAFIEIIVKWSVINSYPVHLLCGHKPWVSICNHEYSMITWWKNHRKQSKLRFLWFTFLWVHISPKIDYGSDYGSPTEFWKYLSLHCLFPKQCIMVVQPWVTLFFLGNFFLGSPE